jgi:hypothetical protein
MEPTNNENDATFHISYNSKSFQLLSIHIPIKFALTKLNVNAISHCSPAKLHSLNPYHNEKFAFFLYVVNWVESRLAETYESIKPYFQHLDSQIPTNPKRNKTSSIITEQKLFCLKT